MPLTFLLNPALEPEKVEHDINATHFARPSELALFCRPSQACSNEKPAI